MTDKVQKIREKVEMVINRRLNLLNGDHFDLNREVEGFTNEIIDIINSLQEEPKIPQVFDEGYWERLGEEPVSDDSKNHISLVTERMLKEGPIPTLRGKEKADFENEFNRFKQITGMINWSSREEIYKNVILWFIAWSKEHLKIGDIVDKSEIDKQLVSDDLEKAANEWDAKASFTPFYMALDGNGNPYEIKQDYTTHAESFKAGAKWQKEKEYTCYEEAFEDGAKWKVENLWKTADGDDLPDIDREVIVLCKNGRVAFGHRLVKKSMARPIGYGRTEEVEVKTYDKGGWNIPDVKWWLDVELPKEIEL